MKEKKKKRETIKKDIIEAIESGKTDKEAILQFIIVEKNRDFTRKEICKIMFSSEEFEKNDNLWNIRKL